ncbi:MAG: response regulator transcription factor [Bdellovibrionaceae bacterium]|nr:response regulator transcription factor [Pseudobdellovibrionaceae bacterium]
MTFAGPGAATALYDSCPKIKALCDTYQMTPHQARVCKALHEGTTIKVIALGQNDSIKTVSHHLREVYRKLQVCNRVGAELATRDIVCP